jgi:hypothetical protein
MEEPDQMAHGLDASLVEVATTAHEDARPPRNLALPDLSPVSADGWGTQTFDLIESDHGTGG